MVFMPSKPYFSIFSTLVARGHPSKPTLFTLFAFSGKDQRWILKYPRNYKIAGGNLSKAGHDLSKAGYNLSKAGDDL